MSGEVKVLQFSEGVSTGAPTQVGVTATNLGTFASDAAYVTDKGSAAANGDTYYNTTVHKQRFYTNGAWRSVADLDKTETFSNKTFDTATSFTDTTQSTTKDTGAVVVEGGVGIEKNLNVGGDTILTGDLTVNAQAEMRLADSDSSNYVALKAPVTIASNFSLTMPNAAASTNPGYGLVNNGSGALYWYPVHAKNMIRNGIFDIWSRGTNLGVISSTQYTADGWELVITGTSATGEVSRRPNTDSGGFSANIPYALRIDCSTADASMDAGDRFFLRQNVEGSVFAPFHQKEVTMSFKVYSPKTGTHCVSFSNSDASRSYVAEYTVSAANTVEYKTITLTLDTLGTWLLGDGVIGIRINFPLMAGSTFQTTAGSWQSGNFLSTSGQQNLMDNAANNFYATEVMFNEGPVAAKFAYAGGSRDGEVALNERYFNTSYAEGTAPGTASAPGYFWLQGFNTTSGLKIHSYLFPTRMATAEPTVTMYDFAGNASKVSTYDSTGTKTDNIAITSSNATTKGFYVRLDASTAYGFLYHYEASSEL